MQKKRNIYIYIPEDDKAKVKEQHDFNKAKQHKTMKKSLLRFQKITIKRNRRKKKI